MTTKTTTEVIRGLNDNLRQHLSCGVAVITPGIAALGHDAVQRIVRTIAVFDDFSHANDPHEEHDFGSFATDGHTIFFKIDPMAHFKNFYRCARCGHEWTDSWSAQCDDDCPQCGARHMSPFKSEDVENGDE